MHSSHVDHSLHAVYHSTMPNSHPSRQKPQPCSSILILIVPLTLLSLGFLAHPFSALQPLPHALPSSNTAPNPSNNFPFSLPISICSFSIHCSHIHPPSNPLTFAASPLLPTGPSTASIWPSTILFTSGSGASLILPIFSRLTLPIGKN